MSCSGIEQINVWPESGPGRAWRRDNAPSQKGYVAESYLSASISLPQAGKVYTIFRSPNLLLKRVMMNTKLLTTLL
jgi:hypothetical protein